jgi:hypothetical protein
MSCMRHFDIQLDYADEVYRFYGVDEMFIII